MAVIASPVAEIRSGPGTNFPASASLAQGHLITVEDAKDEWYEVIVKSQGLKGWVEKSALTAEKVALDMKERGSDTVVYTDISRDGALTGVNVGATVSLAEKTGMNIIASGGMSSIFDIGKLIQDNVYRAILGRAIYNKNIDLTEAPDPGKRG